MLANHKPIPQRKIFFKKDNHQRGEGLSKKIETNNHNSKLNKNIKKEEKLRNNK